MDISVDRRSLLAAGVTVVLWASAFVAIRSAGEYFAPGALALGRMLTGSVVLVVVLLVRREGLPPRQAWPGIIAAGVLWFGVYMVTLNWGEQQVDAGTASMVINVGPVLLAVFGGWLLHEGFPPRVFAGIAVSFAGAVIVGLSVSGKGHASVLGVGLCVVAAVSYAIGVTCQKPALRHASGVQFTTFACLIGAVACLPFAGQLASGVSTAPPSATLNMLYLGAFPTALAFVTWAHALARTTAAKMGSTTYLVPALVVAMSWLLLDEVPGWLTLTGGVLCLAGVAVSRHRPRRKNTPAPDLPARATN